MQGVHLSIIAHIQFNVAVYKYAIQMKPNKWYEEEEKLSIARQLFERKK